MPEKQCEAAEYDFITRRIAEWEEVYARDEHSRERDIRDDLLTFYRRQHEIEIVTVFELRRQVSGKDKSPLTPLCKGGDLHNDRGDLLSRLQARMDELERRIETLEDGFLALVERVIGELVSLTEAASRRERHD